MANSWWKKNHPINKDEQPMPAQSIKPEVNAQIEEIPFTENDPLLIYLASTASAVEIDRINIQSPFLDKMKADGVRIILPLVSQGELIGIINLGPRRSEQDYSSDDRRLLNTLATQAAPALRVAQLARQQQLEARQRERIEQELKVARVIQQTLLPKEVPNIPGWKIQAFWQPAREVSGDFYEFLQLPDGRIWILIADVTDKGVPAALVMATTRSLLRATAERLLEPGSVLEKTNEQLLPDIPSKMFVTCLLLLLDPATGKITFANAGHNLPIQCTADSIIERRASGMPLGLLPGMSYEEAQIFMEPGDSLLIYSDGLIEGHNSQREMFGFDRVKQILSQNGHTDNFIELLMKAFDQFSGESYEQEDDITMVTLTRLPGRESFLMEEGDHVLATFSVPSDPGNERMVAEKVINSIQELEFAETQLNRIETAVAEATMNALEHGNHYDPSKPVSIQVLIRNQKLAVLIRDMGGDVSIPEAMEPDLDAKLAGLQSPRGWGLFLIKNMVDEMHTYTDGQHHTVELVINLPAKIERSKTG
jgi:serine phosphatase RsbU (regulator of sigma subunit)/anti-sigma regulatory factor (Ser/Thr protein kinase)